MSKCYDLVIIGSGPAGLTAAIYAQRARLNTIIIEKEGLSGGQVLTTYEVDNFPGLPGLDGFDLGTKFKEHADRLGAVFVQEEVRQIRDLGKIKQVVCEKNVYETKTIIIATGAVHRKLNVPGEERLAGRGVSYCATCDGAFFRNKTVAVVGGGDVALEDAVFLSRLCKKVYLIHRRDKLRGAGILQEKVFSLDNIEVFWNTVVQSIEGSKQVEQLNLKDTQSGKTFLLDVQGVFLAVGIRPASEAFAGLVEMDHGYIQAGEDTKTSVPGIFAAGDVRTKKLRQVVTAAADGANAVTSAERILSEWREEEQG